MKIPSNAKDRERRILCTAFSFLAFSMGCSLNGFRDRIDTVIGPDDLTAISPVSSKHNSRGLTYLSKGKFGKAESHFHKALSSDPRSAAAHNNIGNMMLSRHELYQAAWEFQKASELAPYAIEPLVNLGLVHEQGDRLDEAAEYYRQALNIDPNNAIAVGNLTRVLVKQDADHFEIHELLKHLIFVDSRREWIEWAEELIATRYRLDGRPRGQLQNQSMDGSFQSQPPQAQLLVMPESNQLAPESISPADGNSGPTYWPNEKEPIDNLPAPLPPNRQLPSNNSLQSPESTYWQNIQPSYNSQISREVDAIPSSSFQIVAPAPPLSLPSSPGFGVRP